MPSTLRKSARISATPAPAAAAVAVPVTVAAPEPVVKKGSVFTKLAAQIAKAKLATEKREAIAAELEEEREAGLLIVKSRPDIIEELKAIFESEVHEEKTDWVILCTNRVEFVHSEAADYGESCCDRNAQMICFSAFKSQHCLRIRLWLVQHGFALIFTIAQFRDMVESGWLRNFELAGRDDLGGSVGNKWLGTSEFCAALSPFGLKIKLIDFVAVPDVENGPKRQNILVTWIKDYYQSWAPLAHHGAEICNAARPLFLQQPGHSRTIVGVEKLVDGNFNIIFLDPSYPTTDAFIAYAENGNHYNKSTNKSLLQQYRINAKDLEESAQDCQILFIPEVPLLKKKQLIFNVTHWIPSDDAAWVHHYV